MNETETYNSAIGALIEPDPIGYSFNTPGWYIVLGIMLLTVFVIGLLQYRKYKKNTYRREALKSIDTILQKKENKVVYEINVLLKTIAFQIFGREKVAYLSGLDWFVFLNSTMNSEHSFANADMEKWAAALYNPSKSLDEKTLNEWADFAILWIKNHRVNV
ncbi:DUF4381 domain-containing protein [uncultured Draconibacterium sp.]|uniref:DUF4381 domain-containing protein n=1 Tax=uncultured Draconibacterium sp. TaxID=1573823 RepID=UPI00326081FA